LVRVRKDDGSIESFDRNKVIDSVRKETGCTGKAIEDIVDDVYNTLSVLKIDPVTGPLIREFVNTKFLERDMNECRRKYTRVGMPVYDARMTDIGGGKGDNANLQRSPETVHKRKADQLAKEQALLMLPEHLSEAHLNGNLHIHDLEYITSRYFCADWDLRYVFYYGFTGDGTGEHTSVAGPAMRPEVAILHASKTLGSGQVNFAGGEGFYNFLCFLSPYFKDCTYKEIKQNMQCFIFEMTQMLTSRGGQQIFSSVQLSPSIPEMWNDKPAIYKGNVGPETYGEFERENRLLFKAFMDVMLAGDYAGKPFYFPKPEIAFEPEYIAKMEYEDEHGVSGDYPSIRELYLSAFQLASKFGTPYFDNMIPQYRGAGKGISCMQCSLLPDTLIQIVDNGMVRIIPISELKHDDVVVTPSGHHGFSHVMIHHINEYVYTIKIDGGRRICGTFDHKIPIKNRGILELKNLSIGDVAFINCELPTNGKIPKFLSEQNDVEFCYLLGLFAAEGSSTISPNGTNRHLMWCYGSHEVDLINKTVSIIKNVFGYDAKLQSVNKGAGTSVFIHSNKIHDWFIEIGVAMKGRDMTVPTFILNAPIKCKWAFINGYYRGDGCLRKNGTKSKILRIEMNTISKPLAEGVLLLTGSLGYDFKYSIVEDKRPNRKTRHILTLNKQEEVKSFFACINKECKWESPIVKIETSPYDGDVYDPVEVTDHLFITAQGMVSSNCAFSFSSGEEGDPDFDNKLYFRDGKHFTMGSAQVITLNMPRYAYESTGNIDTFIELCKQNIQLAIEIFKIKRGWITECIDNGMLPFPTHIKRDSITGKLIPPFLDLSDYVFTIGIVGMNEVCEIMLGKPLYSDNGAHMFTLKICNELNKYCKKMTTEQDIKLSFSRTPAETTAQRFAVLDLLNYGDAHKFVKGDVRAAIKKYAETGSRDLPIYYTNGTHVPVDADIQIAEKIRIEQAFFPILDGGNICNIYLGEQKPDPRGLMDMTLKICKSTNLGYFAFTRDFTVCNNGYRRY